MEQLGVETGQLQSVIEMNRNVGVFGQVYSVAGTEIPQPEETNRSQYRMLMRNTTTTCYKYMLEYSNE